jgi:hypothetical protein
MKFFSKNSSDLDFIFDIDQAQTHSVGSTDFILFSKQIILCVTGKKIAVLHCTLSFFATLQNGEE